MPNSAAGIRAGKAYIELGTLDTALTKGLDLAKKKVADLGKAIKAIGREVATGLARNLGAGLGNNLQDLSNTFRDYEDVLAQIVANSPDAAREMDRIEAAIARVSRTAGQSPTQIGTVFAELLKAGVSLEDVLGGVGMSVTRFAKVSGIAAEDATRTIVQMMNIFGATARESMDALSQAADSSVANLSDMVQAFQQFGNVSQMAGLSVRETAAAIAMLSNSASVGQDAGTSLRTMFIRLMAPVEESAKVFRRYRLNFTNAEGGMISFRDTLAQLENRFGHLTEMRRAKVFQKLFGQDAIRAGITLMRLGVRGYDEFIATMARGKTVAQKYSDIMNTVSGSISRVTSAFQRFIILISKPLAAVNRRITDLIVSILDSLGELLSKNPKLLSDFLRITAMVMGMVVAFTTLLPVLQTLLMLLMAMGSPLGMLITLIGAVSGALLAFTATGRAAVVAFMNVLRNLGVLALRVFGGIANAVIGRDLNLAWEIAAQGLRVAFFRTTTAIMEMFAEMWNSVLDGFADIGLRIRTIWLDLMTWMKMAWQDLMGFMIRSLGDAVIGALQKAIDDAAGGAWPDMPDIWPFNLANKLKEGLKNMAGAPILGAAKKARDDQLAAIAQRKLDIQNQRNAEFAAMGIDAGIGKIARRALPDPARAARIARLNLEEARLNALLATAAGKAEAAKAAPDEPGEPGRVRPPIPEGIPAATGEADVAGTFVASAVGRMGAGKSVIEALGDILEEERRANRQLAGINAGIARNNQVR